MSTPSSGQRTPVDCGVQIRFINDLHDAGGGNPVSQPRTKTQNTSSKYGVAVRVQGIAGQPYVFLKDGGGKGDSYGVQLRTHYPPSYSSLPRRRESTDSGGQVRDMAVGGGQAGPLRRAQSHGSLLDREDGEAASAGGEEFQLRRPPGDGRSGSYGNLDGRIGLVAEREQARGMGVQEVDGERNTRDRSYQAGLNGSLPGRMRGSQSFPDPPPPLQTEEIHSTYRQKPVNRPISRFDGNDDGTQQRGRYPTPEDPRDVSPFLTPNPCSSPPSSTHSSLGRSQRSVTKVTGLSTNQRASPGKYVAVETASANQKETRVTPDLLLDQGQNSEVSSKEEQVMQTIYSILREGTSESDAAIKHKVRVIFQNTQSLQPRQDSREEWLREKRELEKKVSDLQIALQEERRGSVGKSNLALKDELESCLDENLQLQEMLERKKKELHQTQFELTQLRMDRENAEARVRDMEDQMAEFQDELRESSSNKKDLMVCQTELSQVCQLKQKLEETLRQRERELTALKGALKEEVATHDKEIEALREQYSADMERLRSSMEQVSQSQAGIEAERLRVNTTVRSLQQQLEDCRDESSHWMEQFHTTRDELRTTKQELLQARLEKEEFEEELKELQERVSTMKQQIPDPSHVQTLNQELQSSRTSLQKVQSEVEKHRTELDKKVMEVIALKKAHQEQEAELKYEVNRLKDQLQRAKEDAAKAQEKNKTLKDPAVVSELEQKLGEAQKEVSRLREKVLSAEDDLDTSNIRLSKAQLELNTLQDTQLEQEEANTRLKDKLARLEAQLQSTATESSEAELALHAEMRGLRSELDEAKRRASRLGQEHSELSLRLEDQVKEKEALTQANNQLGEIKQQQEKALEKLNKEYESLSASSKEEAQALRAQLEEHRERSRKETQEAQRHGNDAQAELQRSHTNLRKLEEEISRQKKELLLACEERDNHQLDKELLTNRLRHLEAELETSKSSHHDKAREIRNLEDKLKRVEVELEEEKGSVEMLTDRVTRTRDQIDQLRSELMQERSSKQDLELDKNAMERHMKELRSRVADMEGQSRSSAGVSQLESKVQELDERLRSEDREKTAMLASQRRLERKLKDLNMTLDEERQQHTEQRDQLTLKVKSLKRQVDEGETEVDRMDGLRRKAQREMEEQMELKDALQARVTALETELKRKAQVARHPTLDSSALSSEDDDDSLYDPSTITSILTEGNLQTSSC
ncbi:cingulin [Lampris incognitus]|uniref:cingulin n=1 Tax=Lampris incognitus TaxID=2546036 RepID=UPI0024B4DB45|nr:cingulin [Lampris incognitus]